MENVQFGYTQEVLDNCGFDSAFIEALQSDYAQYKNQVSAVCNDISQKLQSAPVVFGIKTHFLSFSQVIEKLVTEKQNDSATVINLENYSEHLIPSGSVIISYLLENDWREIHHLVSSTWNFERQPTAIIPSDALHVYRDEAKANNLVIEEYDRKGITLNYLIESTTWKRAVNIGITVSSALNLASQRIHEKLISMEQFMNPVVAYYEMLLRRTLEKASDIGSYLLELHASFSQQKSAVNQPVHSLHEAIEILGKELGSADISDSLRDVLEEKIETIRKFAFTNPQLAAVFTKKDLLVDSEPFFGFIPEREKKDKSGIPERSAASDTRENHDAGNIETPVQKASAISIRGEAADNLLDDSEDFKSTRVISSATLKAARNAHKDQNPMSTQIVDDVIDDGEISVNPRNEVASGTEDLLGATMVIDMGANDEHPEPALSDPENTEEISINTTENNETESDDGRATMAIDKEDVSPPSLKEAMATSHIENTIHISDTGSDHNDDIAATSFIDTSTLDDEEEEGK